MREFNIIPIASGGVIHNVFTRKERKEFIEKVQPYFIDSEELTLKSGKKHHEGKQTLPQLHENKIFSFYYNRILDLINENVEVEGGEWITTKSWMNYHDGTRKELVWHAHQCPLVAIYYLQTTRFFNSGTQFQKTAVNRNGFVRCAPNSLLVFPGWLEHSVPLYKFGFDRYTLSLNLGQSEDG